VRHSKTVKKIAKRYRLLTPAHRTFFFVLPFGRFFYCQSKCGAYIIRTTSPACALCGPTVLLQDPKYGAVIVPVYRMLAMVYSRCQLTGYISFSANLLSWLLCGARYRQSSVERHVQVRLFEITYTVLMQYNMSFNVPCAKNKLLSHSLCFK